MTKNLYHNKISGTSYGHSEFWRELSWRCGDEHANRICKLLEVYCRIFKLSTDRFYEKLPRG